MKYELDIKRAFIYALAILTICLLAQGQVYMEKQTQHRFAQTYIGLNTQIVPSQGSFHWSNNKYSFPTMISPRLTIGGLHFWGKWDFNFNLPIALFYNKKVEMNTDLYFNPGGDLSARYYPWRMTYGKIRPYGGISVNTMLFGIENDAAGERYDAFITGSLIGGMAYAKNGWQINAELMWLPQNRRTFFSDRTTSETLLLPRSYFSFGLLKYVDFTLSNEKNKLSGRTEDLENSLRKANKLNSFSIGIAPSSAYFLKSPSYENSDRQSIPRHKGEFIWEFGLGYLFYDAGVHLGFSYRDYTSSVESYGLQHLYRRKSLAFETLFFIWDYNGFVPFIGPSISYERWAVGEFENDVQVGSTNRTQMISPGIIFGWDIVPSSIETWVLRTNLRYYPFQKIENVEGKKSRVDQFEFNFIELVLYPSRIVNVSKARRKY